MAVQTGEMPAVTPFDLKLRTSTLHCETPVFVALAAETLRNRPPHKELQGFLRVRMENDTKVS
jgi:hypothetical protein